MSTLAPPMRPVARVGSDATTRRQWLIRSVPSLYLEDIEAIFETLRRHVAESGIERLELSQAALTGRAYVPVLLEAGGDVFDDPRQLLAYPVDGLSELKIRTFGYSVTLTTTPSGHLLIVDDDSQLALRSFTKIRTIIRRRRSLTAGLLTSSWGVPGFVLAFPIVASTIETATGRPGLALAGAGIAAASLVVWLWWTHWRWAKRKTVVIPRYKGDAPVWSPAAAVAVVISVVVLTIVGLAWMA